MTMIKCPECRHHISSMAKTCPECGASIDPEWAQAEAEKELKKLEEVPFTVEVGEDDSLTTDSKPHALTPSLTPNPSPRGEGDNKGEGEAYGGEGSGYSPDNMEDEMIEDIEETVQADMKSDCSEDGDLESPIDDMQNTNPQEQENEEDDEPMLHDSKTVPRRQSPP